jgi:hypothetical protein
VVIDDDDLIPDFYKSETVTVTVSKASIKAAIQDGEDVPGARLIQTQRLVIS